jgi:glucosamine-6-phosphate deaminase
MEPLYAALVQRLMLWSAQDLDALRRRWSSFNLDEYLGLPAEDPCRYSAYMRRHLGEPLQLPPEALHLPSGSTADADGAAQAYAAALNASGGVGVQLLGLGNNGHVGFNEPPTTADQACHVVDLSEATRRQNSGFFGGDPAAVPAQAITLGLHEILAADEIHLVVTGAAKADILKRLLRLPAPRPDLPASWLLNHPCVWLWADADAWDHSLASRLA